MRISSRLWIWIGFLVVLWPAFASADALSDGKQFLLKGDLRYAVVQLRNAVRTDPKNAEAHYLLARTQLELGDAAAAQKEAQDALDRGYDPQKVFPLLASTYLSAGKYDELLRDFQVENKNPAIDSTILVARGYAYTALQQLDAAETAFNEAETLAPNSLQPPIASTRLALIRGDLEAAKKKIVRAERLAPEAVDVQLLNTQILRMQNDAQGALALLDQIIGKQSNLSRARVDRASLYLALGRDVDAKADNDAILALRPNDIQGVFMSALLAARAEDFVTADVKLAQIDRYLGRLPRAYLLKAVVKQKLGRLEQAEDAAMRYTNSEPTDLDGVKLLARIQLLKHKPVPVIYALNGITSSGRADFEIYDLLGRAFNMNAQFSEAVEAFRRARLLAPDNIGVNTRLANARLRTEATDAAVLDLERALRLAPADTAISERLFAASLASGDLTKAKSVLDRIKATLGDVPTVGNLEAMLMMARLDIDAARDKLQDVTRRSPDFILATSNLARLYLMDGKKNEAERLLAGILSRNPAAEPALSMYVSELANSGKVTEAIEVLQRARAASPTDNRLTATLMDLYVRAGDPKNALALIAKNSTPSLVPTDFLAALARAQIAMGAPKDARDTYSELLDRDHSDLGVRRTLASLLVSLGAIESARNTLQDGLKIDPQAFPLMQDLVAVDLKSGGIEPALVTAEKFERVNSDFPLAQALRGDAYMVTGQWDQAIAVYTAALLQFPDPPTELMIRLGAAQVASGNPAAADRMLRAWVRTIPKDEAALKFLADLDLNAGHFKAAEQEYESLLDLRPRDANYLNNLAWIYQQRGDKRAKATAQQAYLLAPAAGMADTLGWILLADGDYPTALMLLRQAYGDADNDPRIVYHYAVALRKSGQNAQAGKILKPVIDSDVKFDERADAAKFFAELSKGS